MTRAALVSLDPAIAMAKVQTMEDVMAASIAPQRFTALLFCLVRGARAGTRPDRSLWRAGVRRGARDAGDRGADGAGGLAWRDALDGDPPSLTLAGVGALAGLLGAMAVMRTMEALLFELRPIDLLVLGAVTAVLLAVAALAGWVPARWATRVGPSCGVAVGVAMLIGLTRHRAVGERCGTA